MMCEVWDAYENGKYNAAISDANKVIEEFKPVARLRQEELSQAHAPEAPQGQVSDAEKKRIFSFGPMNEVAAAWYVKGRALHKLHETNAAIEALKQATEYPYARVYDKDWDGFWSPAESARAWIKELQGAQ